MEKGNDKMNKMKKFALACGMLALVSAAPAMAADASALKYGVVDMGKIVQNTDAAKGIFSELEGKRKQYQDQIKKEEDALKVTEQEIVKAKEKMSKEDFEKKAKEFEGKIVAGQKMVQEKKKTLDEAYASSMGKLRSEAAKVIGEVAKERGYSAVFTQDAVVMAATELDITDEVISRINKNVKKIPVEWKK